MSSIKVKIDDLQLWGSLILQRYEVTEEDANLIIDSIIYANKRGIDSHGMVRYLDYITNLEAGTINPKTGTKIIRDNPTAILIDAENGFGQVAMNYGIGEGIKRATKYGTCSVGVCHSNNFSTAGYLAEKVADKGLIAILMANSSPAMVPWGGYEPLLGTNPLAIVIPSSEPPNIVLDMATSKVARGKITLALKKGEKIPQDWALDPQGNVTTDPKLGLEGSVFPLGGYKGYGLSLMIDILAGLLTGSEFGGKVLKLPDTSGPQNLGHLMIIINIEAFMPLDLFYNHIKQIKNIIHEAPAKPRSCVMLPGEPEHIISQGLTHSLDIPEAIYRDLIEITNNLKLHIDFLKNSPNKVS